MSEQQFEELAKRWPDLFQKSGDFEFSIGGGWFDIVDVLCGFLSHDIETAKRRLKYAMENPNAKFNQPIYELEKNVADALEALPTMVQVKEKFGTMRFYVDGGTAEMHNYISFAEAMTSRTCEVCGDPGKSRQGRWIKVLCDKHSREQDLENGRTSTVVNILNPNGVKLSDEWWNCKDFRCGTKSVVTIRYNSYIVISTY